MKDTNTNPTLTDRAYYRKNGLLGNGNTKTLKGEKRGYYTEILHLAPAMESGVMDVCTSRTKECTKLCLDKSGRARIFRMIRQARIRKTRFLFADREGFIAQLRRDILRVIRKAESLDMIPCIRVNGTSDLPWLALLMASEFPMVQFYDYTKHIRPYARVRSNYHLTFSYSGENMDATLDALSHGINAAVVFEHYLPKTWNGFEVINGDESDLRFLDPKGVVVGLKLKDTGEQLEDGCKFVVRQAPLVQLVA